MHSTYLDNIDNLAPSIVKRFRDLEDTDPIHYRNTILAEWTLDTHGAVYAGWGFYEEFHNVGDVWYGLDFGYGGKDRTSLIKINYFDEVYYVSQVFSDRNMSTQNIITKMRHCNVPFTAAIFCDSAMPLMIRAIQDGGYGNARKCKKGKIKDEIKKVADKHIVVVGNKLDHLFTSYLTFKYDKNDKLPHEPDELAALRYGINSKKPDDNPHRRAPRPARRIAPQGGFL